MSPIGVHIRTIKSPAKVQEALLISKLLNYVVTPPEVDFQDSDKYQNQVAALVKAIKVKNYIKPLFPRSVKVQGDMDVLGTYALGDKINNSYCFKSAMCEQWVGPEI